MENDRKLQKPLSSQLPNNKWKICEKFYFNTASSPTWCAQLLLCDAFHWPAGGGARASDPLTFATLLIKKYCPNKLIALESFNYFLFLPRHLHLHVPIRSRSKPIRITDGTWSVNPICDWMETRLRLGIVAMTPERTKWVYFQMCAIDFN